MILMDELKPTNKREWLFHLTGVKHDLEEQLKNSLGDAEMYQVARELKKVLKTLDKLK